MSLFTLNHKVMTVKHIRRNYAGQNSAPMKAPSAVPAVAAARPSMEMVPRAPAHAVVQNSTGSSRDSKSWITGIIVLLLVAALIWYLMSRKKGSAHTSYFY